MQRNLKLYPGTIVLTSLFLSVVSPVTGYSTCVADEQTMLVTAYYSPKPDQKRYYLGSYEDDIRFNGKGIAANDGTPVYPGMLAAPAEYPFGTIIEFPELGIVGKVHDRGGRINMAEDGTPHIDIWMGEGEEGLARALEWGARFVKTKVYKPQPAHIPEPTFDLAKFPAPESALSRLPSNPVILVNIDDLQYGDTNAEIAAIQHALKKLGYFDHDITSFFGDVTLQAIQEFQRDAQIVHQGKVADEDTRQTIVAHRQIVDELEVPLAEDEVLLTGKTGKDIRVLQRILTLLNLYDGEIDGIYSQEMLSTVFAFQQEHGIVSSLGDPGAGMVGPETRRALLTAWREHRIEKRGGANSLLAAL